MSSVPFNKLPGLIVKQHNTHLNSSNIKGYISHQQISNIGSNYEIKGCLSGSFPIRILLAELLNFMKATIHITHKASPAMTKSYGKFFFGHVE